MMQIARMGSVFVGIWLVLLLTIAGVGERIAPVHEEMKLRRAAIRENANKFTAVSLGSSHARAVDFAGMGIEGFYFWRSSGDLHETAFLAREMMSKLPNLQCVFISLSPYSIHVDNATPAVGNLLSRRRELYGGTTSFDYIPGDRNAYLAAKLARLARDDHWKYVFLRLAGRPALRVLDNGYISIPRFNTSMSVAGLEMHGARVARSHEGLLQQILRANPSATDSGRRALEELLSAAAANGTSIVLYTSPLRDTYIRAIPSVRLEEAREAGIGLSGRFNNVFYADFATAEPFASRPELFMDSNHLNAAGARLFSRILAERLREEGASACVPSGPGDV